MKNRIRATLFWVTLPICLPFLIFDLLSYMADEIGDFLSYTIAPKLKEVSCWLAKIHLKLIVGNKKNKKEVFEIIEQDFAKFKKWKPFG